MTSTTSTEPVAGRLARAVRSRLAGEGEEGGFILLEVMISLTLITAIMAAISVEYVNGMVLSASQRTIASASQVASSALSDLRTVDATDLLRGRDFDRVRDQRNRLRLNAKVADRIGAPDTYLAYDNAAATQVVSTTAKSVTVGTRTFAVDTYLECQEPAPITTVGTAPNQITSRTCHDVDTADGSDVPNNVRATVAVVWQGARCPAGGCAFVASTLVDMHANPTFDVSQPLPAAPVVASPGNQTVARQEKVSLQLLVQDGRGAAPFTWALTSGSLPAGLTLSPSGLISGTVGSAAVNTSSTITVTDAFLRQAPVTISWTVIAELVLNKPIDQVTNTGQAATPLTLTASGGSGTGYRFTDPDNTLPTGLTLNATTGQITGTPTKGGKYTVEPVVTDSSNKRTATTSFTWSVGYPPLTSINPQAQVATVGRAESVQVVAGGGSGRYRYTVSSGSLPNGLSLGETTGLISGTPSSKASRRSITVRIVDTQQSGVEKSETFTYEVVDGPGITTPSNQASTKGGTANLQVVAECFNGPCRYTADVLPNGLSIDASSGRITGTVATNAVSTTVRVTVVDHAGASATTDAFTWTVNAAAAPITFYGLTSPYKLDFAFNASILFTGGTGPFRYTATGLPSGATLDPQTGLVSGTLANSYSKNAVTIKQVDASGVEATSSWTWWVSNIKLDVPNQTFGRRAVSLALGPRTSGGTAPYSYFAVDLPEGLRINGNMLEGTPTTAGTYNPTIRVTDSTGAWFDVKPQVVVQ